MSTHKMHTIFSLLYCFRQCIEGYQLDKAYTAENNTKLSRKHVNGFSRTKTMVRCMLMFAKAYPAPRPQGNLTELTDWQQSLLMIAEDAQKRVYEALGVDSISPHGLATENLTAKAWNDPDSPHYKALSHLSIPERDQETFPLERAGGAGKQKSARKPTAAKRAPKKKKGMAVVEC